MTVDLDDELSIHNLIERLRKLGESPHPIDGLRAVVLGAALGDRLNESSDRQIGQLLFDCCWPELYVHGPELIIVTQAIDRLRRSTGGAVTNKEAQESLKQQPACPKCGNEMFLHYGIDEPDFWLCDYVGCQHKRYVDAHPAIPSGLHSSLQRSPLTTPFCFDLHTPRLRGSVTLMARSMPLLPRITPQL